MLKQVSLEECIGKTVAAQIMDWDSQLVIKFTDGTFVALTGKAYRDSDPIIEEFKLTFDNFDSNPATEIGIYTKEEYAAYESKKEEDRKLAELQHKVREFERLKKELGK